MGRSTKAEAARTRQRIVETACDLFRVHGVDHVSIADVMGALGLTTGGFYKHFASKEALVAETFQFAFDRSSAAWPAHAERERADGESAGTGLLRYYLRPNPQGRCPIIAFAEDASRADPDGASRDAYCNGTEDLFKRFMNATRSGASSAAADRKAMVLFAAMVGARRLKEAAGDTDWLSEIRNAVLELAAEDETPPLKAS